MQISPSVSGGRERSCGSRIRISRLVAMPTLGGLVGEGKRGFEAIWPLASVMA